MARLWRSRSSVGTTNKVWAEALVRGRDEAVRGGASA